jgi:hypothetical protein
VTNGADVSVLASFCAAALRPAASAFPIMITSGTIAANNRAEI